MSERVRGSVINVHNLGAIVRTAHAAGAGAVIIPERRAAGLTANFTKVVKNVDAPTIQVKL